MKRKEAKLRDHKRARLQPPYPLRTTTALHSSAHLRHITAKPLLLRLIPSPRVFEGMQVHVHDSIKDLPLALVLNALDQFV